MIIEVPDKSGSHKEKLTQWMNLLKELLGLRW
jgi:hypothetical protein